MISLPRSSTVRSRLALPVDCAATSLPESCAGCRNRNPHATEPEQFPPVSISDHNAAPRVGSPGCDCTALSSRTKSWNSADSGGLPQHVEDSAAGRSIAQLAVETFAVAVLSRAAVLVIRGLRPNVSEPSAQCQGDKVWVAAGTEIGWGAARSIASADVFRTSIAFSRRLSGIASASQAYCDKTWVGQLALRRTQELSFSPRLSCFCLAVR
jgi:hypothetical protein